MCKLTFPLEYQRSAWFLDNTLQSNMALFAAGRARATARPTLTASCNVMCLSWNGCDVDWQFNTASAAPDMVTHQYRTLATGTPTGSQSPAQAHICHNLDSPASLHVVAGQHTIYLRIWSTPPTLDWARMSVCGQLTCQEYHHARPNVFLKLKRKTKKSHITSIAG